jgi:hypothetical protein
MSQRDSPLSAALPRPYNAATDDNKLRTEFGQFGTVTDVFLPMDRNSGRLRGFGFVTMADRESAEKAIAKMDQSELDGRTIRVNESRPKGERGPGGGGGSGGGGGGFNASGKEEVKLYVGNLSFDTAEPEIRRMFEEYGPVTDCFMPTDRDSGKVRGFCFVTMASADAEKACNGLNGRDVDGRALRVNEAQPRYERPNRRRYKCRRAACRQRRRHRLLNRFGLDSLRLIVLSIFRLLPTKQRWRWWWRRRWRRLRRWSWRRPWWIRRWLWWPWRRLRRVCKIDYFAYHYCLICDPVSRCVLLLH